MAEKPLLNALYTGDIFLVYFQRFLIKQTSVLVLFYLSIEKQKNKKRKKEVETAILEKMFLVQKEKKALIIRFIL